MNNSFWSIIYASFREIKGWSLAFIGIILSLLFWHFSPNKSISLGWFVPIGVICLIIIITLSDAIYKNFKINRYILPKVLVGREPSTKTQGEKVLCLLEPSELFSHDTLVSFYYIGDENFEQLIGIGTVINIQEDGKIQAVMIYSINEYEEKIKKLAKNDASILRKIRVKPNIPRRYLAIISQGG